MIKPTKEQVNAMDLSEQYKRLNSLHDNFLGEAGSKHYRLLAYISSRLNNIQIAEVGTLGGCGGLALSYNPNNRVVTYDIRFYDYYVEAPDNLTRKLVTDASYWFDILNSELIFYDADHNGNDERKFLNTLVEKGWKGIIIWDDIHFNEPMKKFWQSITQTKEDWTDIGHSEGTGIVWI